LIPREKIDDVRERTNLVEVVRRHVELKRAGTGSWKGLCPFHAEKTPSFHVHETRQFFNCFGCGEKGDVFAFLTKIEQRSFMEVLRDLAQQSGVELPEKQMSPAERRALADAESEKERMLRTMELATSFFEGQLATPAGDAARAYLASRGISPETAKRFRVGYAPAGWDGLQKHLAAHHIPIPLAVTLGLVGAGERGHYDFFRDRVMLPVLDRQKRPVGYSSRLLDPEAKDRKYVNSPDSPLFHKKENLYGLHAALDAIRRSGLVVVVEGNFDVLSLHEAGIAEAVAPMGTALTAEQLQALSRVAKRIVAMFDGDKAGAKAGEKTVPLAFAAGLRELGQSVDIRFATLPRGVDPDDYVRREGAEAFRGLIERATPIIDFFIQAVATDGSVPGRAAAVERVVEVLGSLQNPILRDLYAGELAGRLQVPVNQVQRMLRAAGPRPAAASPEPAPPQVSATTKRTPPKEQLEGLVLLVTHPELAGTAEAQRIQDLLVDPGVSQIYRIVLDALRRGERPDVPAWLDACAPDIREAVGAGLMREGFDAPDAAQQAFRALKTRLELSRVNAEIEKGKSDHKQALEQGDSEQARAILQREIELLRMKGELSNGLARP
jgi:DNA primase